MGRKIFVSYKYADHQVENLDAWSNSSVRDYVTEFENILEDSDDIYKGEGDDEDLSDLDEETIWSKLKDRIYDSSVTVVFISLGMKESNKKDKDQWIPWEISYSLKETSRKNKNGDPVTSRTNAMVAVVLPDTNGSYSYYLEEHSCCLSPCTTHHRSILFQIIRDNKFNLIDAEKKECDSGSTIWYGESSYIKAVKWADFKADYKKYIEAAVARRDNIENYKIAKNIE